jgi:hypothetical protein
VARTLPTAELGSVVVPAERSPGFAAACCLVARLRNPRRPVLAVTDEEPVAVLAAARALGVAIPIEVWTPAGVAVDPTAHWARLADLVGGRVGGVVTLATDPGQLAAMVDAAGPIAAWGGLAPNP